MKRIPFNLEYYQKHHPMLVLRSGNKVRIVDTQVKDRMPILGLVEYKSEEIALNFYENGISNFRDSLDLFMLIHECEK